MVKHLLVFVASLASFVCRTAAADDASPPNPAPLQAPRPPGPALHHVPLVTAPEGHEVTLSAEIEHPELVKRATVVYRHGKEEDHVDFARSTTTAAPYVAVIPADHVTRPYLGYTIEIERTDGAVIAAFATRQALHVVEVVGDSIDAKEEALLARLHGRRFVMEAGGQYASFGPSTATLTSGGKSAAQTITDSYYQVEAGFTYRMLRTVSEFGVRAGVYRGTAPVPGATNPSQFDVGLNYGAPWVRLRAADWLHFDAELLTSVTEVGFSVGGGGAMIIGDPYAGYLMLGFESIQVFGTRGYSRFQARVLPFLTVAPTIEVTNMPHASSAGVRLLMDLGFDLGAGLSLVMRGGYEARSFASGGPSGGGVLRYAF